MPRSDKNPNTKKVEIQNLDQNSSPKEEFTFSLGPDVTPANQTPLAHVQNPYTENTPSPAPLSKNASPKQSPHLLRRLWYIFEWLAVSAAIFALLFLVINFQSYSDLITSKFNQITGQTQSQLPQDLQVKNVAPESQQQPLPIAANTDTAKKQIPDFNMPIAPPDYRVVIPRIGRNVPIVNIPIDKLLQKDFTALEKQIQDALRNGVLHFPGTAEPGENGNVVITGHSSYFPWDPGRFKDVFALLHQVEIGDEIIIYKDQREYKYIVYDKFVVHPDQVDVLTQNGENKLTLITCTPVGTALNRLIVVAHPEK